MRNLLNLLIPFLGLLIINRSVVSGCVNNADCGTNEGCFLVNAEQRVKSHTLECRKKAMAGEDCFPIELPVYVTSLPCADGLACTRVTAGFKCK